MHVSVHLGQTAKTNKQTCTLVFFFGFFFIIFFIFFYFIFFLEEKRVGLEEARKEMHARGGGV